MGDGDSSGSGPRRLERLGLTIEGSLVVLLRRYLQTVPATGEHWTEAAQQTGFGAPRSADVDALVCRLVMDGEDVGDALGGQLGELFAGTAVDRSEFSGAWCRQTAAALHRLGDLEGRLIAYAQACWQEERRLFGFSDFEATEPPEEWLTTEEPLSMAAGTIEGGPVIERPAAPTEIAGAGGAVVAPGAPAMLGGAIALGDQRRFLLELEREVARGHRGLGSVSVVLIEDSASGGTIERVRDRLRPYDACCLLGPTRLGLILPGTTASSCGGVVARLRRSLTQTIGDGEVAVGIGTWPEDGVSAAALLDRAERSLARDRRRHESGEVEFDSVPPFMAEQRSVDEPATQSGTLWIEGLAGELRVQAESTEQGVRLRAPLAFLQSGAWVRLRTNGGPTISGRLEAATMGRRSKDDAPVLQLDVLPPPR